MHNQSHTTETSGAWLKIPGVMQECIQNCLACYQICSHLMEHCLKKGGPHADPKHIKILNDCATICQVSADFMIRNSEFHGLTCGVCAEICLSCAQSCESMAADDAMMKACAEACRKCASSCEEMSKMH